MHIVKLLCKKEDEVFLVKRYSEELKDIRG